MADNGGWYTRRKRKHDIAVKSDDNKEDSVAKKDLPSSKISTTTNEKSKSGASRTATFVPESLLPHLGWTKLSACHRPRSKNKRRRDDNNNNWNRDEALQKVTGRALVRWV